MTGSCGCFFKLSNRAGGPRVVFLSKLVDYGVDTFRLTADELEPQVPLADLIGNPSPLHPVPFTRFFGAGQQSARNTGQVDD